MFKDDLNDNPGMRRSFGNDNSTGKNTEDSLLENTPVKVLTASSIIGDRVENFKGEHLGIIKDIMLNIITGYIDYIVLEFGGFLGIGGKLFAIPHKAFTIDPARQILLLKEDRASFKNAPGFDKNHWPETNSRHFEDVNNFWGYGSIIPKNNSDSGYSA